MVFFVLIVRALLVPLPNGRIYNYNVSQMFLRGDFLNQRLKDVRVFYPAILQWGRVNYRYVTNFLRLYCFYQSDVGFQMVNRPRIFCFNETFQNGPKNFYCNSRSILFRRSIPFIRTAFRSCVVSDTFKPSGVRFFILGQRVIR